jgi:hypothetical protein
MTEKNPLPESHEFFIHSDTVTDECSIPVAHRWAELVVDAPELRVPLFELAHIRDLYEVAYKEASGSRLGAYLNHAYLLAHYLHFLEVNGMIVQHAHATELAQQQVWIAKFIGRYEKTKGWRRGGPGRNRISKPYLPDTTKRDNQLFH